MTASNMIFRLELGKHSAPGINRSQNEDYVGYYFPQQSEVLLLRGQMFLIADGTGDEGLGEFASKMAIQTIIQEYFEEPWIGTVQEMLAKSLLRANNVIYDANIENRSSTPFSTSLTCAVIHQENLYIAHVGNCRAYLISNANFEILTQSHSFDVQTSDRAINIPGEENGQVLVRTLGTDKNVNIDLIQRKLQINDIILLCTDGVYISVPEQEIQHIIASASPQQACELIVKMAIDNQTPDDTTALLVKVKSIKRLEVDEKPQFVVPDQAQPIERQIVIKGIRYRTTLKADQMPPEEEETVAEFSQDRDVRRPIIKRTPSLNWKQNFPIKKILNIITLLIFLGLIAFLIIRYVPEYWPSLLKSKAAKVSTDTLTQVNRLQPKTAPKKNENEVTPMISPEVDQLEGISEFAPTEEPPLSGRASLKVVIIDGSFRQNLSWNQFIVEMKRFSEVDRISQVKSSLRLGKSKVLWRRDADSAKVAILKERANQYQQLFYHYFQASPEIQPLDLTLVIGADFKLPRFQTSYRDVREATQILYYLEILNGYTVPGLAKRLSEQLDYRKINDDQLTVVDYRNADKKNYKISFIKCDAANNSIAAKLKKYLGLKGPIDHTQLYDIKLIVGTDIVL